MREERGGGRGGRRGRSVSLFLEDRRPSPQAKHVREIPRLAEAFYIPLSSHIMIDTCSVVNHSLLTE